MATDVGEVPRLVRFAAVTANCGNSTIGADTSRVIADLLQAPGGPDVLVINCQEVHAKNQLQQLNEAVALQKVGVLSSDLMVTRTKPTVEVMSGNTGIATFVLYKKDVVRHASFDKRLAQEVRGKNKNKGGYLNTLTITGHGGEILKIKTISGHLDSNSERVRAEDWKNIKQKNAFEAKTWDELLAKVPLVQIAGYDANTRDLWDEETGRVNMWHQDDLHPHIAPMALAPLGTDLYSAENTYKTSSPSISKDTKRSGYATGGSLDFVAIQNNTVRPSDEREGAARYRDSPRSFAEEPAVTKRDHNVITSPVVALEPVTPFDCVRYYLMAELMHASPQLTREVAALEDTPASRAILLALHKDYLSPHGQLIENITMDVGADTTSVAPWFEDHTLDQFLMHHLERQVDAVNAAFMPKRLSLSNRLRGEKEAAILSFNESYQDYCKGLKSEGMLKELQETLVALERLTNNSSKVACIHECQAALSSIYAHLTTERSVSPSDSVSTSSESPSDSIERTLMLRGEMEKLREPESPGITSKPS